jgi:hypothetical protein
MKKVVRTHRSVVAANRDEWISERRPLPDNRVAESGPENSIDRSQPSHEAIARLAYALWEQSGRPDGSSERDWLQAEQQLGETQDRY